MGKCLYRNIKRETSYSFYLGYVDNDDIPELFVSEGNAHGSGVDVYTYHNGEVVMLCTAGSYGSIIYIERKGYICGQFTQGGICVYSVYEVKNGTAEKKYYTYDNTLSGDNEIKRTINDTEVTEEEMQKFSDEYFGKTVTGFGEEYGVTGYEPTEENYQKYIAEHHA